MYNEENDFTLGDAIIILLCSLVCWFLPTFLISCGSTISTMAESTVAEVIEEIEEVEKDIVSELKLSIQSPSSYASKQEYISIDDLKPVLSNSVKDLPYGNDCGGIVGVELTREDIDILAACLYLECRGESIECQEAICSLIINRLNTGKYGDTISGVVYAPGQFSTAPYLKNVNLELAITQYEVIETVMTYGTILPPYVVYFRANKYHRWSDTEDYMNVDNTFFSSSKKLKKQYEEQQ